MALKAKAQIQLNETRDTLRETNSIVSNLLRDLFTVDLLFIKK